MKQLFILSCLLTGLIACNKDKFQTKPSLEVESLSADFIPRNQNLVATFSSTDKQGDVDDSLFVIRTRTNARGLFRDSKPIPFKIPSSPNQQKGEIALTFRYALDLATIASIPIPGTSSKEPDSLILQFVLRDKEKNLSDTATANVRVERF